MLEETRSIVHIANEKVENFLIISEVFLIKFLFIKNKQKFPWKSFFVSLPLNSIYVANFAFNWGNYFFITKLPAYVEQVLKFSISEVICFSARWKVLTFPK